MIWFEVFYCLWLPLMLKKQISAAAKSPAAKSQFLGISGALQALAQVLPGKNFPGKAGFKPFPGQPRSELQVRVCCGSKQGIPADPWECGGWAGAGLCLELPRIWTLCQAAVPSSQLPFPIQSLSCWPSLTSQTSPFPSARWWKAAKCTEGWQNQLLY